MMSDTNSYSGEDLSDEEEDDGEELDPRVNDELEKLNVAANSVNHLEAELDEARVVFRHTMARATQHLNDQAQKLGKCIEKARPFYDTVREMRRAHHELQVATLQFEKANSRHVYAKQRVREAEQKVMSDGGKRGFDFALQEMLNQATIEVSEAESKKKESWEGHQKTYKFFQDIQQRANELRSKLKKPIEKAKPYFSEKFGFDRHLWHLKLRVDAIQQGLNEAKRIYSGCLKSLEVISDDIHQKRKDRKMKEIMAKLQKREEGVGAESSNEDEASLNLSQLDLDLDCNASLSEIDGILPLPEVPTFSERETLGNSSQGVFTDAAAQELRCMNFKSSPTTVLERRVSGAENLSFDYGLSPGPFVREVYGSEKDESFDGEGSSKVEAKYVGDAHKSKAGDPTTVRQDSVDSMDSLTQTESSMCSQVSHESKVGLSHTENSMDTKEGIDSLPQTEGHMDRTVVDNNDDKQSFPQIEDSVNKTDTRDIKGSSGDNVNYRDTQGSKDSFPKTEDSVNSTDTQQCKVSFPDDGTNTTGTQQSKDTFPETNDSVNTTDTQESSDISPPRDHRQVGASELGKNEHTDETTTAVKLEELEWI